MMSNHQEDPATQLDGYEATLIHHALDEPYPDPAALDLVTDPCLPDDDFATDYPAG